jgi:hypothetical protein
MDQHERKSVVLVLPIYLNIYYFRVRESRKGGLDKMSARIGGSGANGSVEIVQIIFKPFQRCLRKNDMG